MLAFITALTLDSDLIAFEEPENCIHPYLLETIIDLARKSGKQVIISTHSPYLLDHVKPEEVILVYKEEGATKAVRLEKTKEVKKVKEMLEEGLTLGEIWYAGIFK